jgi:sulfur-oxidizing protein SoxX
MALRFATLAIGAAACIASTAWAQSPQGLELFLRADKGYCIACHQLPPGAGPQTRSNLGPRLEGPRMRSLGRAALRDLISDPTRANPDTVMTPYGRHRILEPAEIDRLVEYLHALP